MLDADGALNRLPIRALPVEVAAISDAVGEVPTGYPELLANSSDDAPSRLVAVNVLVRIEVSRIAPDQPSEGVQLRRDLSSRGRRILRRDHLIHCHPLAVAEGPFTEVDMETHAQRRICARVPRGG